MAGPAPPKYANTGEKMPIMPPDPPAPAALFFARPAGPVFVFSLFDRGVRLSLASSPSSTDWNRARRSRSTLSSPPFSSTLFDVLPLVLVLRTDDVMNDGLAAAALLFVAAAPFPPDARARARFEALSVSGSPGESDSSPSRLRLGLPRLFRSEKPAVIIVLRRRDLASLRKEKARVVAARGEGERRWGSSGRAQSTRAYACVRAILDARFSLASRVPRSSTPSVDPTRVSRGGDERNADLRDCDGRGAGVGKRTSPPGSGKCSRRICRGGGSSACAPTSAKHPGCLEKWDGREARGVESRMQSQMFFARAKNKKTKIPDSLPTRTPFCVF